MPHISLCSVTFACSLKKIYISISELEEWKEKCKDLEAKHSQSSNKEFEDNTDVLNTKLTKLQDELQVRFLSTCVIVSIYLLYFS